VRCSRHAMMSNPARHRMLATKPGWRFTSERNLHDHFQ
jgi:hypothetical protein